MDIQDNEGKSITLTFKDIDELSKLVDDIEYADTIGPLNEQITEYIRGYKKHYNERYLTKQLKQVLPQHERYKLDVTFINEWIHVKYGSDCIISMNLMAEDVHMNMSYIKTLITDIMTFKEYIDVLQVLNDYKNHGA